ncbi:MAG: hypothetical protein ABL977_09730, partial [Candidatus Eisenbacteria bacterium]
NVVPMPPTSPPSADAPHTSVLREETLAALEPRVRAAAVRGVLCLFAALLALAPYVRAVAGGDSGAAAGVRLALDARALASVLWGGAVLFPFAALALVRSGSASVWARSLAAALAVLVLPVLVVHAGGDNQSKLLNLGFALAAAPAAIGIARIAHTRARRAAFVLFALAAWLPGVAAMGWAYAHQSDGSADAPSRPPAALLVAVLRDVPAAGVVVDATQDTTRGAAPALAGATGRALLWSGGFMARKWGYGSAALQQRAAAAAALATGRWPADTTGAWLEALGREVWVLAPDDSAHASDPRWHVVARADGVALARFAAPVAP